MSKYIRESFNNMNIPDEKMPLRNKINFFLTSFTISCLIGYIIILLTNIIRIAVKGNEIFDWVNLALVYPIYSCLFLLPISFPLFWIVLLSSSNARLLTLFQNLSNPKNLSKSKQEFKNNIIISESNRHKPLSISVSGQMKNFFKVISSITNSYYDNLTVLGSVTSVCCVDKTGLLADLLYAPEKLLFSKLNQNSDLLSEDQLSETTTPSTQSKPHVKNDSLLNENHDDYHHDHHNENENLLNENERTHIESNKKFQNFKSSNETESEDVLSNKSNVQSPFESTPKFELVTLDTLFDRAASKEEDVISFQGEESKLFAA
jgi:hypothetical protein